MQDELKTQFFQCRQQEWRQTDDADYVCMRRYFRYVICRRR